MRCCDPHWAALREAIEARGLAHLVSSDGEELHARMHEQAENGELTPESFDPLFNASLSIMSNALTNGGVYLMGTDDAGNQYCPLCELQNAYPDHEEIVDEWIGLSADEQLVRARKLKLVAGVQ